MTSADQLVMRLHISLLILQARELPTREERIAHVHGQVLRGPHYAITRDEVVIDKAAANEIADLLERESPEERAEHLRRLNDWRATRQYMLWTKPEK